MKPTKTYTPGAGWRDAGDYAEVTTVTGWVPMAHAECPPAGCSALCRVARALEDARGCATCVTSQPPRTAS